jgi:type 1 fimbria pilin
MRRSYFRDTREVAALVALTLVSVLPVTASSADGTPVRFEGRVQWIAGETLTVATDDDQSISVDLTHVPQDQYQRLGSRDRVVVTGTIPTGANLVIATSIKQLET